MEDLEAEGFPCFGPRKNAAIIEGSKAFSKDLMKKYGMPLVSVQSPLVVHGGHHRDHRLPVGEGQDGYLRPGEIFLNAEGPRVIEYNCRFGDPETQVVLPLLESSLLEIMLAVSKGTLAETEIKFSQKSACCVILCLRAEPFPLFHKNSIDHYFFSSSAFSARWPISRRQKALSKWIRSASA